MKQRLAIVTTHPIQYNAPWFRLLAASEKVEIRVFYTWQDSQTIAKYDPGFNRVVEWDIPLLEGYDYTFVKNVSANQGSHHFKGIDNPTLCKEIENWKADAVLVFGWAYKSHLKCLRYFKGKVPVIFRGDSTLLDATGTVKKIIRKLLLTYIYSHIDYALYVGTNNKQYFLSYGVPERKLIHAPHAIDNDRFVDVDGRYTNAAKQWKEELGISANDFVLLFAGKLEHKKNPEYLLNIAKQILDTNLRFIIVGNGELEEALKASATNDNRIIFIDFQNQQQMPVVYRLADVFILPSRGPQETWGLAINEAMACRLPVIASSKAGGAIDLISGNGIIIDPDDTSLAIMYIKQLMTNKNLQDEHKQVSSKRIEHFSYQHIVSAIETLVHKIS